MYQTGVDNRQPPTATSGWVTTPADIKTITRSEKYMPIYEYQCENCNCQFEKLMFSEKDPAPQCPSCCGSHVKKLISAGSVRAQGIAAGSGGFSGPACKPSG